MSYLNEVGGYCPACGAEYRSGYDTCADDGTPLTPGPAPEPDHETGPPERSAQPGPAWEPVAELRSSDEAHILAGRLQAEGIEAFVDPPQHHSYYGAATAAVLNYRFKVLVPPHRLLEAAEVIRDIESGT